MLSFAGFSFWVPATVQALAIHAPKKVVMTLEITSWGNQHGLNFTLHPLSAPSTFDVLLPEEESGVWFDAWGPPALFAANTQKWAEAIETESLSGWHSVPTPAYFAQILADDSARWGLHAKTLEEKYIPADALVRANGRKVATSKAHGQAGTKKAATVVDVSDNDATADDEEAEGAQAAGQYDIDYCSYEDDKECLDPQVLCACVIVCISCDV